MSLKKILIIDDDRDLLLGLAARLKANRYQVVCAMDGAAGILLARQESPDLIILDLGLPGEDGILVLGRIRELPELMAIPVIVLTARSPVENHQHAMDAGAVAFFQKPTENNLFLSAIRETLGETAPLSAFLRI
jgi:two-component system cell cycle response regulator